MEFDINCPKSCLKSKKSAKKCPCHKLATHPLVSLADKKLGLTQAMADAIRDPREQGKVDHHVIEMSRERVYAICQDYEDANDLDTLRHDPALKMACDRLPKTGDALASQPTISRFENMPGAKDQLRWQGESCLGFPSGPSVLS